MGFIANQYTHCVKGGSKLLGTDFAEEVAAVSDLMKTSLFINFATEDRS